MEGVGLGEIPWEGSERPCFYAKTISPMVSFNHYINPIQTKGLFIIYGREGAGDFFFRGRQKLVPPLQRLAQNKWPPLSATCQK